MLGRITVWNADKGYGFVRCSDGRDYFLHITNYAEEVGVPSFGTEIEFKIGKDPRSNRTQAMNARRVPIAGVDALRQAATQEGV
jgi:cold shock CspA family protein